MTRPVTPVLDYAQPPRRRWRLRDVPGVIAIPAALGMTAASLFTAVYAEVEEPFYEWNADPTDVFVCWVMPVLIVIGWVAWAALTFRRTRPRPRPRWATVLILLLGLPAFAWSMALVREGSRSYYADRAMVAEWRLEAAEAAAAAAAAATAPAASR